MGKIVLWIVVVFAILLVLRLLSVAKARRDREARKPRSEPAPSGPMVRCSECGVFLPKADALPSPRGFRCSDPACAGRGGTSR